MPEEFGTVNLKPGAQTREIDLLRRHYRTHREAINRLIPDAPSAHLAAEYQRLIADIDMAVRKLDELEGKPKVSTADTNPLLKTGPGNRPLVRTPEAASAPPPRFQPTPTTTNTRSRVMLIVVAGIVVLVVIAWLMMRGGSDRKQSVIPIATTTAPPPAVTPAPVVAAALKVTPAVADYGTIRKGTRAVRQFEVTNNSDNIQEIEVARSNCRCLYYDYNGKLPARGKETVTVTVDAAKAKAGLLQEEVEVHAKTNPAVSASFMVQANIR